MEASMTSLRSEPGEKATPIDLDSKPAYPPGTTLHLEGDVLAKLGLSELPEVGRKYVLHAKVEVVGASKDSTPMGAQKRLTLQITEMALADAEPPKPSAAQVLYGNTKVVPPGTGG